MGVVGCIDEHVAAGINDGGGVNARGRRIIDIEHIDRTADADNAGGDAEANHHDVFRAARRDRDVAERVHCRGLPDIGLSGIGDDIGADRRRHPDRAARQGAGDRQVIEIVAGADQYRLRGVSPRGAAVDRRVVADIGLGRRIDDVDPGRHRDPDNTGRKAQREGADLVAVRGCDRDPAEWSWRRCETRRAYAAQRRVHAGQARTAAVAVQVHRGQHRRVNLPLARQATAVVVFGHAHGAGIVCLDPDSARVARVEMRSMPGCCRWKSRRCQP